MLSMKRLNWARIRALYDERKAIHDLAAKLRLTEKRMGFAELVLGVSDPAGNFSASRHGLGQRVLAFNDNPAERVHRAAEQFAQLKTAAPGPGIIERTGLQYFQVAVGSEVSCLVNPKVCWVANRRTIWAHLVVKHDGNTSKANQELSLYRDADADSEMDYSIWGALHGELAKSMPVLVEEGTAAARRSGIAAGALRFLWGDVVADGLYEKYHG
jgi:hypothetical protein